jgi:DNA polymerase family A
MRVGLQTTVQCAARKRREGLRYDLSTARPVCAGLFFDDEKEMSFRLAWAELQQILDNAELTFVVHDCQAAAVFFHAAGMRPPANYIDTLLMGIMLLHAKMLGVAGGIYAYASPRQLASRYGISMGTSLTEVGYREMSQIEDQGRRDNVACINAARAVLRLAGPLCAEFAGQCGPAAMRMLVGLYQPYAMHMATAARSGLVFDKEAWDRVQTVAPQYRKRLLSEVQTYCGEWNGDWNSGESRTRVIVSLGMEARWPRSATGSLSGSEDDLKSLRHHHVGLEAVYKLLRFDRFMLHDIGDYVDNDGRLRCRILPLAQRTSRNSTTSPNLGGIPGDLRPLLLPDPGCAFVHFDFSQQEVGVAAFLSDDRVLLEDFGTGDVYERLGRRIGQISPNMSAAEVKSIRQKLLKPLLLAIMYGRGVAGIASDLGCTDQEAALHVVVLKQKYRRLFDWLDNYAAEGLQRGWAENIIGFRAAFKALDAQQQGHTVRSCRNFPIQASAAACFQMTGLFLADLGADIRLPMHDAYLLNVANEPQAVVAASDRILKAATTASGWLFPDLPVKLNIEVLECFAKDGKQDSLNTLINELGGTTCGHA